jgi:hypothetical protein
VKVEPVFSHESYEIEEFSRMESVIPAGVLLPGPSTTRFYGHVKQVARFAVTSHVRLGAADKVDFDRSFVGLLELLQTSQTRLLPDQILIGPGRVVMSVQVLKWHG